jgi:DNA-binding CsgD family transcriptional regulator
MVRRDLPGDDHRAALPGDLTATETRIARLACRGLTNPQIAAELSVEPSTVRWHMKNVFRKLEVKTRTQLVASLLQKAPELFGADTPGPTEAPPFVGEDRATNRRTEGSDYLGGMER